jgi:hypothetical protein
MISPMRFRKDGLIVKFVAGVVMLTFASASAEAQLGGHAGAYSRMGFGAEGMGMANALTAVSHGDLYGYYNPAVLPYAGHKTLAASFGVLSLDRRLNFISYSQALAPEAGIGIAIINSGVGEIDGRDSDGEPTGKLSTSENQIILSFANRFKAGFSVGINLKFLQSHLYTDINTFTVGVDVGVLVPVSSDLTLGGSVRDINSKYKWDTATLYGQSGNSTTDDFPLLYTVGASYALPGGVAALAVDVELSNQQTLVIRSGAEFQLAPEVTVRGGIDRIDLKEEGSGVRPALGLTFRTSPGTSLPLVNPESLGFSYAYLFEPFSTSGIHMISLTVRL